MIINTISAKEVAGILDSYYVGDAYNTASNISSLSNANRWSLTFCTYRKGYNTVSEVYKTCPAITICDNAFTNIIGDPFQGSSYIFVNNAKAAFSYLLYQLLGPPSEAVDLLNPNITIYKDYVTIGQNFKCFAGTVIGHSGLGPVINYTDPSNMTQFRDIGNVVIGNNVQIGANCSIARAPIDSTILEDHVMIANSTNIGHNAHIKQGAIITSSCMVARSIIGKNAWLAPGCTILPGVNVGDNALIGAGSIVTKDVPANMIVKGNPARVCGERVGLV